ncbi:hypothetical protein SAMN04487969_101166 [Paenibacillus algorifonticola]|uniref:Uncharacterized protein n=1 Tax=Paenibacillus algorifonticola TaxID=684063 RepID=A0A1I1XXN2_9BACL|nr:DUF6809 family protein [Paenibacillus algorifonticola]SFE12117.1 hypothetical protein SAMN04487969_101166 [Paenibacillus algorifonticola]
MRSLLEELCHGNMRPDVIRIANDPEYLQMSQNISEVMEAWKKKHTEDEFTELEALLDLYAQAHSMELTSTFTYGFRLGAGIMIEVLTGKEELAKKLCTFSEVQSL